MAEYHVPRLEDLEARTAVLKEQDARLDPEYMASIFEARSRPGVLSPPERLFVDSMKLLCEQAPAINTDNVTLLIEIIERIQHG